MIGRGHMSFTLRPRPFCLLYVYRSYVGHEIGAVVLTSVLFALMALLDHHHAFDRMGSRLEQKC